MTTAVGGERTDAAAREKSPELARSCMRFLFDNRFIVGRPHPLPSSDLFAFNLQDTRRGLQRGHGRCCVFSCPSPILHFLRDFPPSPVPGDTPRLSGSGAGLANCPSRGVRLNLRSDGAGWGKRTGRGTRWIIISTGLGGWAGSSQREDKSVGSFTCRTFFGIICEEYGVEGTHQHWENSGQTKVSFVCAFKLDRNLLMQYFLQLHFRFHMLLC